MNNATGGWKDNKDFTILTRHESQPQKVARYSHLNFRSQPWRFMLLFLFLLFIFNSSFMIKHFVGYDLRWL